MFEVIFVFEGECLIFDLLFEVIRVELQGMCYYVKCYWGVGKGLRCYFGWPWVKVEWQNFKFFVKWGIFIALIVVYGLECWFGAFVCGALVMCELEYICDMVEMVNQGDVWLCDSRWVAMVSWQLVNYIWMLHDHYFIHNDLKWRNLLVNDKVELFFIDCFIGSFWRWYRDWETR